MQDVNKKRFWLHKIQLPVTIFVHNVGDPVLDTELKNEKFASDHSVAIYGDASQDLWKK